MTPETASLLHRSACTRAVLAVLRTAELSVPGLAYVLAGRYPEGTIRRSVLELRRLGRVVWDGTWAAAPACGCGKAKVWRARV